MGGPQNDTLGDNWVLALGLHATAEEQMKTGLELVDGSVGTVGTVGGFPHRQPREGWPGLEG